MKLKKQPTIRIATWNLERPCDREQICPDFIVTEINAVADVDVWILTEVQAASTHPKGFALLAHSRPSPVGKHWTAIWVREGIKAKAVDVCEEVRTRAACVLLPETEVGPIFAYGSVLWGGKGMWMREGIKYRDSLANQKKDWQRIHALKTAASFCLAGDLNQSLDNVSLSDTTNKGWLRNALKETQLTCLTARITHSFEDAPEDGLQSIDHICVSDRLTLASPAFLIPEDSRRCSFRIPKDSKAQKRVGHWYTEKNDRLSDHHGVVVTLSAKLMRY
jgi:hypothetical protein